LDADDKQLLKDFKSSSIEAFKILFQKYQPILLRYVFYRTQDRQLSDDIVQETFLKVWNHRSSIKPHKPFFPYIIRISQNITIDHVRHRNVIFRYQEEASFVSQSVGDNPEDLLHLTLLEEEIVRVVNNYLPNRCRTIFLLSRIEGKENREIAEMLGIKIKTVENQITEALRILRLALVRYL